jgi:hypothetical protein
LRTTPFSQPAVWGSSRCVRIYHDGWFSTGAPPSLDRRNTAGGVASGVSRFVASGGPPPIGADGTYGQCDSSGRPASAGRTIPTIRNRPWIVQP